MSAPKGIDVSSYQAADYGTSGIGYVFVKATEGTAYVNPRHAAQVAWGRDHDLVVGHYHFVRPGNMSLQAGYFLAHALPRPGEILCLDWEDVGVSNADKDTWLRLVTTRAPQCRVVLYCNRDFWINRDRTSFAGDGLWIADPDSPAGHPNVQHPWLFHQYGESNGLDLDVANFPTQAALEAWAAGTAPAPTPENDMPLSDDDVARVALAVNAYRNQKDDQASVAAGHGHIPDVYGRAVSTNEAAARIEAALAKSSPVALSDAQVQQVAAALAANPGFVQALATGIGKDIAARMQS